MPLYSSQMYMIELDDEGDNAGGIALNNLFEEKHPPFNTGKEKKQTANL